MTEVVYSFSGKDSHGLQESLQSFICEEVYEGDFFVENGRNEFNFQLSKEIALPAQILLMQSEFTTSLRRSQHHIRRSSHQFYAIWVLLQGSLEISHSGGVITAPENRIVITDSVTPFLIKCLINDQSRHAHYLALVPQHRFHSHISGLQRCFGMSFPIGSVDSHVVVDLLELLFRSGGQLERDSAEVLMTEALKALTRLVEIQTAGEIRRISIRQTRLQQIYAHIDFGLADPDLSLTEVARKCSITPRYLCQLMRDSGTTFNALLRQKRQEKAREWLAAQHMRECTIAEVAKMAGYRSSAQFSRIFHAQNACTPREFRKSVLVNGKRHDH